MHSVAFWFYTCSLVFMILVAIFAPNEIIFYQSILGIIIVGGSFVGVYILTYSEDKRNKENDEWFIKRYGGKHIYSDKDEGAP